MACNFTKEDFDTCANSLRTIILKNICERLLLNFIQKETPTQVFSCEFCELIKNTYFVEGLQTASSEIRGGGLSSIKLQAWQAEGL